MDNYVTVVFDTDEQAFKGLHALWDLDAEGDITVHGAAVIHRDNYGNVDVATKRTNPGLRTAAGIGLGALLGALAGPIGAAAGATIAGGTAAGLGAAAGGIAGLSADMEEAGEHEQAAYEAGFEMKSGQSAVIAEVSEGWTVPLDTWMSALGGTVYRRPKSAVRDDSLWGMDYASALYPYDYEPYFPQPK